jgi:hypothetical protein
MSGAFEYCISGAACIVAVVLLRTLDYLEFISQNLAFSNGLVDNLCHSGVKCFDKQTIWLVLWVLTTP